MRVLRSLILIVIAAVLVSAGPGDAAQAMAPHAKALRDDMLSKVNQARRNHHIRPLKINWRVSNLALAHSRRMARRGAPYHTTNLYSVVRRYNPRTWGENVAKAGTLRRAHQMFMNSGPHRANILNRAYRRIGIGVKRERGKVYVTIDFYG